MAAHSLLNSAELLVHRHCSAYSGCLWCIKTRNIGYIFCTNSLQYLETFLRQKSRRAMPGFEPAQNLNSGIKFLGLYPPQCFPQTPLLTSLTTVISAWAIGSAFARTHSRTSSQYILPQECSTSFFPILCVGRVKRRHRGKHVCFYVAPTPPLEWRCAWEATWTPWFALGYWRYINTH